ncbi:MAG: hypothetical protein ACRERV_10625 [Methylococcales bacterium]
MKHLVIRLPDGTCHSALAVLDNDGDLDVLLVQGQSLNPPGGAKTLADAVFLHPSGPLSARLLRNDLQERPDGRRQIHFTDITATLHPTIIWNFAQI